MSPGRADRLYALKEKRVKKTRAPVRAVARSGSPSWVPKTATTDYGILCVIKKKFVDDDTLADVTHSLFRRVIAVIARHARRSWILARGLHALGDLLEAILPHLNPLRHVAHRGVFCE